jgi:hypothetical protein
LATLHLEAKEVSKIERDLLAFLLVASYQEGSNMLFPTFTAIAKQIKRFIDNRSAASMATHDLNFEIRTDELADALYKTGIPYHICQRNARTFMALRPDFDLRSPKHRTIARLLDFHANEFTNAYLSIGEQHGLQVADAWLRYIRDNDIIYARICQLPDDLPTKYLFGGL